MAIYIEDISEEDGYIHRKKLNLFEVDELKDVESYYILTNCKGVAACPSWNSKYTAQLEGRMGLSHNLLLCCSLCDWEWCLHPNECKADKKKQERNTFEANIRLLVGWREICQCDSLIDNLLGWTFTHTSCWTHSFL